MRNTVKTLLLAAVGVSFVMMPNITQAQEKTAFTEEQKTELNGFFRQFLSDNPELIMDSLRQHQMDQKKKAQKSAEEKLKDHKESFVSNDLALGGNPKGDVTVVAFFDYNCGYCKKAFKDISSLIGEDKNVRIVFQDYPILSPVSEQMARLGLAAKNQGKYFEMHEALMEYDGSHNEDGFLALAKDLGLDIEKLKKDAKSDDIDKALSKTKEIAQDLGIRGTPGFIIGERIYPGAVGVEGLREAVKEARKSISDAAEKVKE